MASCKSPYEPREDSTLLEHYVREYAKGDVLDMGTGSGIQAIAAAHSAKVDSVIATDVMKSAIDYCKKCIKHRKIKKFLISDLFEGIKRYKSLKGRKFDTIVFNPPYLPDELQVRDLTLEGGKKGYEVIERFLNEATYFLKLEGIILLVFSSLTKKEKVDEFIRNNLLEFEMLEKQHYFFEDIYAYKIEKLEILKELEAYEIKNLKYFAKGKRGLIFTADYGRQKIAIKINNPQSQAFMRMENESRSLGLLNKHGIGPKLLFHGDGFLAYKFVEGQTIGDFLHNLSKNKQNERNGSNKNSKKDKKIIVGLIKKIIAQMYELDKLKINKQEMSHPHKHIIIGKSNNPVLIDFERCKHTISPSNVTQFCDFLASEHMSGLFMEKGISIDKDGLINAARAYKKSQTNAKFKSIIKLIELG